MAELADALDSKSSGAIRAGSSPASGIRIKDLTEKSVRSLLYTIKKHERIKNGKRQKLFRNRVCRKASSASLHFPTVAAQLNLNMALTIIVDRIYNWSYSRRGCSCPYRCRCLYAAYYGRICLRCSCRKRRRSQSQHLYG